MLEQIVGHPVPPLKPLAKDAKIEGVVADPRAKVKDAKGIPIAESVNPKLPPGQELGDWIKQAEIFRDYWVAQPGVKGRKANWSATWRNWVRRASEQRVTRPQSKETPIEMGRRLIREFEDDQQNTSITGSIANVISLPRQQG